MGFYKSTLCFLTADDDILVVRKDMRGQKQLKNMFLILMGTALSA